MGRLGFFIFPPPHPSLKEPPPPRGGFLRSNLITFAGSESSRLPCAWFCRAGGETIEYGLSLKSEPTETAVIKTGSDVIAVGRAVCVIRDDTE